MAKQLQKIKTDKLYFDSTETEISYEAHDIIENLHKLNKEISKREEAGLMDRTNYNFYNAQLDDVKARIEQIPASPLIKFLKKNGWFISIRHQKFNNN